MAVKDKDAQNRRLAFVCSKEGYKSTESQLVTVAPKGLHIHFIRINIVKENNVNQLFTYPENISDHLYDSIYGLPKIKGWKYYLTTIRAGWIYIYNEGLKKIQKFDNFSEKIFPYTTTKKGNTIWAAFCDEEWSQEYIDKLSQNADERAQRMQKINWNDWYNGRKVENALHVDNVKTAFHKHNDKVDIQWMCESIPGASKDPARDEYLFLCLNDPMGIAYELAYDLQKEWVRMDALIQSMRTGLTQEHIYELLKKGAEIKVPAEKEKERKQILALHNIALTLKSIGYVNEQAKKKIGNNLDLPRMNLVLAEHHRQEQRRKIQECRLRLVEFLSSKYYSTILDDYSYLDQEILTDHKYNFLDSFLLKMLNLPQTKDAGYDTPEEAAKWEIANDECHKFILETLAGKNSLGEKIIKKQSLIEDIEDQSHFLKLIGIINGYLDLVSGLIKEGDTIIKNFCNTVNTFRFKVGGKMLDKVVEVESMLQAYRNPKGVSDLNKIVMNMSEASQKIFTEVSLKGLIGFDKAFSIDQVRISKDFEQHIASNKKLNELANFKTSPFWAKLLRNTSLLNLAFTTASIRKSKNKLEKFELYLKVIQAGGDAYIAQRGVLESIMKNKQLCKEVIKKYEARTKVIGKSFGYFGAALDGIDAVKNFYQGDYDAGAAYAVAAILGAVGVANIWNPLGWLAVIGAGVASITAVYLEDDEIESFSKNCIFRSVNVSWKFENNRPRNYYYLDNIKAHLLEANKKQIIKWGDGDWHDHCIAYNNLLDRMYGGSIKLQGDVLEQYRISEDSSIWNGSYHVLRYYAKSMKAEICFGKHFSNPEQLEYEIFYFKDGVGKGKYEDYKSLLFKTEPIVSLINEENKPTKAELSFTIPYDWYKHGNEHTEVIVLTRLNLDEEFYLPTKKNGTSMYLSTSLRVLLKYNKYYGERFEKEEGISFDSNPKETILKIR